MPSSSSNTSLVLASSALFASGLVSGAALYAALERRRQRAALASNAPLDPKDWSTLHDSAAGLVDIIVNYHKNLQRRDDGEGKLPVRTNVSPGDVLAKLANDCPEEPESYNSIYKDCEDIILPGLTHWSSPNFLAYFKTFGCEPSVLADMLCASLNIVGFSWVAGPAATELEMRMCDWMAKLMKLPDVFLSSSIGGGVIQGTASDSLLCCLVAARNRALAGLTGDARIAKASRLVVYVSDQTHSIGAKGCLVLDLPNLRVIKTHKGVAENGNYGLHPDDLASAMAEDVAAGLIPFVVVATVGTTSTTAIDPVPELVAVARSQNEPVWVHLDAAYGGAAGICPEYRHWLNGVEHVDSFCINPHKWLMIPTDCSLLWVCDRRPLIQALALDPEYLKNDFMSQVQYKDWQVALGRRFRSLKLWFTMRRFGANGLRTHIRQSIQHAKQAERLLLADGRFTIFTPVRMALVCFYVSFGGRELSEALMRKVNDDGKIFFTHSVVDGVYFLRLSYGGLEVDQWHVSESVEILTEALTVLVESNADWRAEYDKLCAPTQ